MNKSISVTIKPTLSCNMRCNHCYHSSSNYPSDVLDLKRIERILELAAREYNIVDVLIHGGEPTFCGAKYLRSIFLLEETITNKSGTKFYNTIQTNGLALSENITEILIQNKCSIGISYDGPHNQLLRPHSRQVLCNIQKLQSRNIKFHILCVETGQTIGEIIASYEWFKKEKQT